MLFAIFGLGIAELVILGTCCAVPFGIGAIAFLLMFRGGPSDSDDANDRKKPRRNMDDYEDKQRGDQAEGHDADRSFDKD